MGKIIYLNTQIGGIETLPAAVGDGRTLGLSPIQFDTLKKNADSQIVLFRNQKGRQLLKVLWSLMLWQVSLL